MVKSSINFFKKNLTLKYVFVLSKISIAKCVLILDLTERKGTHLLENGKILDTL